MAVYKLTNSIQDYPWGSDSVIPALLGLPNPDRSPMAELWMGAHPKAPSRISFESRQIGLDVAIASEPAAMLGESTASRFDKALPFLFKVLAAEKALSIQAHPNKTQAAEGFDRENRDGIPVGAPNRNYRDANHKPEIVCALSEFWALCGFRPVEKISSDLGRFNAPLLREATSLMGRAADEISLEYFVKTLLNADSDVRAATIDEVVKNAKTSGGDVGRWVVELNGQFPGDIGVLAPHFLNLIRLSPGQALYLDAGILHAYLHGASVELMANSDNVLRGGLTGKHVDIPELVKTLVFRGEERTPIEAAPNAEGVFLYPTKVPEFELSRVELDTAESIPIRISSAAIAICVGGNGDIGNEKGKQTFTRGDSFYFSPESAAVRVNGDGTLFLASVPDGG